MCFRKILAEIQRIFWKVEEQSREPGQDAVLTRSRAEKRRARARTKTERRERRKSTSQWTPEC